jgi:hypothetical protein
MLGNSKILNTSNVNSYSENFRDITMNNQQVNIKNLDLILKCFLYNLRDYTKGGIFLRSLRYSPIILKDIFWNYISVNKISYTQSTGSPNEMRGGAPSPHFIRGTGYEMSQRRDFIPKRNLSIGHNFDKLNPNWVTGFTDAEGCFSVIIDTSNPLKGKVRISFEINLHEKDKDILYKIQSFFGVGAIYHRPDRKKSLYRVTNVNYINDIIIPHFINYPLISKKRLDFLLWCEVIKLILKKEHLTEKGFSDILSLYASINTGVSNKVSKIYPNIVPADIPTVLLPDNLNPEWVSGFVAGDGGFSIYVKPAKDYVLGEKVYCSFHIAQHSKDLELIKLFIKFFGCGSIRVRSNSLMCDYIVQDTTNLLEKIIPHFDSYPVLNLKQEDYKCFKDCMIMLKLKQHLTQEGLNKIKSLNLEMNSNRLKS